jgi:DNA adenine methylase
MLLTRLGNKRKLAGELHQYFPPHRMRVYLFAGALGSYFKMPKSKYTIINDFDDDVTNLYMVVENRHEELTAALRRMPVSMSLANHWMKNRETDPVKSALRFLFLSNFTYLGKGDTLRLGVDQTKARLLARIEPTLEELNRSHTKITSMDFRDVIRHISFADRVLSKDDTLLYLDPPYYEQGNTYNTPKWTRDDMTDCLELMVNEGIPAAMSEFDHPEVIDEAEARGLNVFSIASRRNIKNRRTEILITNYAPNHRLF